jgi:hypothetical protein
MQPLTCCVSALAATGYSSAGVGLCMQQCVCVCVCVSVLHMSAARTAQGKKPPRSNKRESAKPLRHTRT